MYTGSILGVYSVYTGCILGVYWVATECILGVSHRQHRIMTNGRGRWTVHSSYHFFQLIPRCFLFSRNFHNWDVDQLTMRGHIDIIDHVDIVRTLRIMAISKD